MAQARSRGVPHVASPSQLLDAELRGRLRQFKASGIAVTCEGRDHRLGFDGRAFRADDHDEGAEAVLTAVGARRRPASCWPGDSPPSRRPSSGPP